MEISDRIEPRRRPAIPPVDPVVPTPSTPERRRGDQPQEQPKPQLPPQEPGKGTKVDVKG